MVSLRRAAPQRDTDEHEFSNEMTEHNTKNQEVQILRNKNCGLSRTTFLRMVFLTSLFIAATVCGAVAYIRIQGLEENVGEQTYASMAASALDRAASTTSRKLTGADAMASIVSNAFPNASQWPFVALDGYGSTASEIAKLSASTSLALDVFVRPDQATRFEEFAKETYQKQRYHESAGYSDFGFGIFAKEDGKHIHKTDGISDYGSDRTILAVIFQHNIVDAKSLMYDVHSEKFRGTALDSMMDCAEKYRGQKNISCTVLTEILELIVVPGPSGLIFTPIFPANNSDQLVGFIGTSVHWQQILKNVVPSYVDGLDAVISTKTRTFTYKINNGIPALLGEGDLHDRRYSKFGQSVVLSSETNATASARYTLTVYPSAEMFDEFVTNSPMVVTIGLVAVILFCAAMFFLYDYFMKHESHQRVKILEMKRRFVRFISHEIRTPLNTVSLGLELLQAEIRGFVTSQNDSETEQEESASSRDIEEELQNWDSITLDIKSNTDNAIEILNDLLNYDKIEQGVLKLQINTVHIWDLVEKVVTEFQIQAKNRQIQLGLENKKTSHNNTSDLEAVPAPDLSCFNVIGDKTRLAQVIRNILSNSLKFVPENGHVDVTTEYKPEGLPCSEINVAEGQEPVCFHPRSGSICIHVKDDGVGMDSEQLAKLFSEGVQFDPNKLQGGGGSGLGLFITKALVEQHGGIIQAESDGPGKGTTITIELPLNKFPPPHIRTDSVLNSKETDMTFPTTVAKKHNILVVDDALLNRKMLVRLLERSGHTCTTAADGQMAIDRFLEDQDAFQRLGDKHVPIDTVLMDFEMPVLNGPKATQKIRELGFSDPRYHRKRAERGH